MSLIIIIIITKQLEYCNHKTQLVSDEYMLASNKSLHQTFTVQDTD